ncbi:hypothetical protein WBO78_24290 [Bosea sp. CCNWLW174]|uniref:hypothetical protein n=1 Tax=unclassified Bosea (in: a-proteobacteria) TaxID=2653178 RepID=UPI00301541B9
MRTQPHSPGSAKKIVSSPAYDRQVISRELSQDQDGKRFAVIVYRPFADLNVTRYEMEDGTPVRFIDDCLFAIASSGRTLTRCEL